MLSHFGALMFLAVWHGLHSGYYATFFFEFIVMTAEKSVSTPYFYWTILFIYILFAKLYE